MAEGTIALELVEMGIASASNKQVMTPAAAAERCWMVNGKLALQHMATRSRDLR